MSNEQHLFYQDPYRREFDARVLSCSPAADNRFAVILDHTAFYPEGGGQPPDLGHISGVEVLDVQENDAGEAVHVLSGPLDPGTVVHGVVDWSRRFDHMQQHSGQHILSAVFEDLFQGQTVGFHLGAESTQIDLTLPALSEEQAASVEERVNSIIFQNHPVSCIWVKGDELDQYPLRKRPAKSFDHIRLVLVDAVDCCPCGGTHVRATGEIGLVKIRSWERKNNNIRVDFVCGGRALVDYQQKNASVRTLCETLSIRPAELLEAVNRQISKQDVLMHDLSELREELNRYQIQELLASAPTLNGIKLIRHVLPAAMPGDVNIFAKHLAAAGNVAALIAGIHPDGGKVHLVFCASPGIAINMGTELKAVLPLINGKGGGNPSAAQGGGASPEQAPAALEAAERSIREQLQTE